VKNFIAGQWIDKAKKIEVRNPFDDSIIDTVPKADAGDLEKALAYAERGAKVMAKLSSYERWKILRKAADLLAARNEDLGQTISQEEGKVIAEGRGEASRAVETMMGSAEEAKRIHGETVPLDADPTGSKKFGFTLRVPCGVVAAEVFKNAGIKVKPVTLQPDVKSVLTQVETGNVDAGMVYVTDVQAAGSKVNGVTIPASDNASTLYPIATINSSKHKSIAQAFMNYVLSPAGQQVLTAAGFEKP